MVDSIHAAYDGVLEPVFRRHRRTLAKLEKLVDAGEAGRARVLWRTSGLLDDMVAALVEAGGTSADAIRDGLRHIREVVTRDDR